MLLPVPPDTPPPLTAVAPPEQDAWAKPSALTELPQTLIGACTTVDSWLPLSTPAFQPVTWLASVELAAVALSVLLAATAPPLDAASAKPSTPTALPATFTGAWTVVQSWLPLAIPAFCPVVASACAAPPATSRKPAESTPTLSDLRTHVFIRTNDLSVIFAVFDSIRIREVPPRHFWRAQGTA